MTSGKFKKIIVSFFSLYGYNTIYMFLNKEAAYEKFFHEGNFHEYSYGKCCNRQDVIAHYAGSIAMECFGIVGMAGINVKDGLVKLLKKESMTRGINVSIRNNKLTINFHVIVAYGVSILAVTDNLISNVKYKLEEFTGIEVAKINIFVEGVRVID